MRSEAMGPMEKQTKAAIERLTTPALIGMPVTLSPDTALTTGRLIRSLSKLADVRAAEKRAAMTAIWTLTGFIWLAAIVVYSA